MMQTMFVSQGKNKLSEAPGLQKSFTNGRNGKHKIYRSQKSTQLYFQLMVCSQTMLFPSLKKIFIIVELRCQVMNITLWGNILNPHLKNVFVFYKGEIEDNNKNTTFL